MSVAFHVHRGVGRDTTVCMGRKSNSTNHNKENNMTTMHYDIVLDGFTGTVDADSPEDALRELIGLMTNNARSAKWLKKHMTITVYRNRAVLAYHDPKENN